MIMTRCDGSSRLLAMTFLFRCGGGADRLRRRCCRELKFEQLQAAGEGVQRAREGRLVMADAGCRSGGGQGGRTCLMISGRRNRRRYPNSRGWARVSGEVSRWSETEATAAAAGFKSH
jgi:hypothetical protein